jgi:choline kinase
VVVGCEAERVRRSCGRGVQFVENTRFAQTNSLYSLWLARSVLTGGFVVMNGDVLVHPQLLSDLLCDRHDAALLVEYRPRSPDAFGDEEMKVKVRGGCVVDIRKTLPWQHADGENVGIAKFGPAAAPVLLECLDEIVSRGGVREWAPQAFRQFARVRPLHVVGTRGLPWIEIDFPADYERAERVIVPLVEARDKPVAAHAQATVTVADAADWRSESGHV